MNFALTDAERLILSNQYTILAKLSGDKHEAAEYEKLAEHLNKGHSFFYADYLSNQLSPVVENYVQQFVIDVLSMYRAMQRVAEDTTLDKSILDDLRFPGFDGNNEPEYLGFAMALHSEGRFEQEFAFGRTAPYFNSHSQSIELYDRMLDKWREFGKEPILTLEQVQAILEEQVHPENR
ncbi:YfbU family protein [Chitinibacter sp. S2-10]|uniref:YfbU family protein n=1 Tax=Chitinibacter sp. S2-10 TaxID=3373597 RepID=UPI0039778A44